MDKFILFSTGVLSVVMVFLLIAAFRKPKPIKIESWSKFALVSVLFILGFTGLVLIGVYGGKALIITVTGPCIVFCAAMDYDWFMKNYKAAIFVTLFGRDGARVVYIFLGLMMFFMGLFLC